MDWVLGISVPLLGWKMFTIHHSRQPLDVWYGKEKKKFLKSKVVLKSIPGHGMTLMTLLTSFSEPDIRANCFSSSYFLMDSSDRLFHRQGTIHDILGGGLFADVVLWRKKIVSMRILLVTIAVWVVFEISGYTLLSLGSSVLLLLTTILFLWAKSASILNRPAPPLPELQLSEEMVNNVAALARTHINALLSVFQDIALGKDSLMFFKVAASMLLISIIGGLTDFVTLGYASLVILLTVPALYEKYEDCIDNFIMTVYSILRQSYVKLDEECLSKAQNWILEKKKLS